MVRGKRAGYGRIGGKSETMQSTTLQGDDTDATAMPIRLADVGVAMAACRPDGVVIGASPSGLELLALTGWGSATQLPAALPARLWRQISEGRLGDAIVWRSTVDPQLLLGLTRYRLGSEHWLLVMGEISEKHRVLSQRLHQQRLEAVGRLVAATAHDLRSPLASIVFSSDVIATRYGSLLPESARETLCDLQTAANRLRGTIDCLLDYVRLGPPVSTEVSLKDVLVRVASLLRPLFRRGAHHLNTHVADDANLVRGNSLAIEQILVNLIVNSLEAARGSITVNVTSERASADLLRILVEDDGPGIGDEHRLHLFDPFFTTKQNGTGLGLSTARDAARAAGGDIKLIRWTGGATFSVSMPSSRPRAGELS
jgi:signal transduction histidine kinase